MRAGTQTLIQALQAIPWADDPDNDDEAIHQGLSTTLESDSSDEEDTLGKLRTPG
jgi:sterol 3beta-glucosyltransferase